MKTAGIAEIKAELKTKNSGELLEICLRLARSKKENKELLTYLLFESADEGAYISQLKKETEERLADVNRHNLYLLRKQLRNIVGFLNKHLKYTTSRAAEAEVLLHFCGSLHQYSIPYKRTNALLSLYQAQIKKIKIAIGTLHADLQYDFTRQLDALAD
jgi:hypothetical protein